MKKVCSGCKKELELKHFHRRKASKQDVQPFCIDCQREYHAKWQRENSQRIAEYKRQWRAAKRNSKKEQ